MYAFLRVLCEWDLQDAGSTPTSGSTWFLGWVTKSNQYPVGDGQKARHEAPQSSQEGRFNIRMAHLLTPVKVCVCVCVGFITYEKSLFLVKLLVISLMVR